MKYRQALALFRPAVPEAVRPCVLLAPVSAAVPTDAYAAKLRP